MPELELFLHEQHVGTVKPARQDRTRVELDVDRDYRPSVLLSEAFAALPGRRPASGALSDFLGGYVPEGIHRETMAAKRRIDKDGLFALLREFGGSIAGAVTLRGPDEVAPFRPRYEPLDEKNLSARLRQALKESDQGAPDDSRSVLPGYQPKVLAARFGDEWAAPHGRAHSTHILKPQIPQRPSRIFDEHYGHLLTRRIGLSIFDSRILKAGHTTYLAIERFDRLVDEGAVLLHHQEDLAQALGLDWRSPSAKFQDPSWPKDPRRATVRKIAELLGSIPGAVAAVETWIRQLTFHVAIGNNDAHAKNAALMHLEQGTELSQIYDAVPNLFQEGLISWDLALAIDGVFDRRRISVERLLAEVGSWGVIRESRAATLISQTLASLRTALDEVQVPAGVSSGMVESIGWSLERLLAGWEISRPKG